MSILYYTKQDEFDLVNSGQDCIGWTVVDQTGGELGKVTEMLINVESEKVDSILIDDRRRVPAADFALKDGRVVVRGVSSGEFSGETADITNAPENYQPLTGGAGKHVAGLTRKGSDDELTIPIVEEQLQIGKRTVESGGARVRTTMTETPVEQNVDLREENVTVERHQVDRPIDADAPDAFKEGSFDVTTRAEVPVISKEARVVEEVVINKEVGARTETVRDSVKRTDVDVSEINDGQQTTRQND